MTVQLSPAIPAVGRTPAIKIPSAADERLRNGLRVIAVRRPAVPRVEARLRIPAGLARDRGDASRARLLAETLLAGTEQHDSVSLARELQRLGASIDAHADPDDLVVRGATLSNNLPGFLALLAEVVTLPTFPANEIAIARDRLAQEITIQRSQPQAAASEAMAKRLFGAHPYGRGLPDPQAVRRVGSKAVATYQRETALPKGASLVLVGDLDPRRAVAQVADAIAGWRVARKPHATPAPGPIKNDGHTMIVHRPGSVQTNIRLGGDALPLAHPDYFRFALANMVFGGYFTSRLVSNIREEKGYTYGGSSAVNRRRMAATLSIAADVRTEVTAAALAEIRYELMRMVSLPVTQDELDAARRYMAGVMALSIQTQAGLASMIDSLVAAELDLTYLREYRTRLESVTVDDVLTMSRRYLAPRRLLTVMVGDAEQVEPQAAALDPVRVVEM